VLLVSPFLPYPGVPHAGGKLVYHLLSLLSRNHSVHLVTRVFPEETKFLPEITGMVTGFDVITAPGPVERGNPVSLWKTLWSYFRLTRLVEEVIRHHAFDVCQVEFTETGMFWKRNRDLPAILTCHDIIAKPAFRRYAASNGLSRWIAWGLWKGKLAIEKRVLSKFDRIFTLSEEDLEWGKKLYPGISFRVLRYPGGIGFTGLSRHEIANRVLFLGALHRPPNIDAVRYLWERVWPMVREQVPQAELWIAGGGMPGPLKEKLSGDPSVKLIGFSKQIEEIYKTAAVFVAPVLEGGGVIVKILDAMSAGVAVVTTPYGNEGIRAKEGLEILVADRPDDFAEEVVRLLRDVGFKTAMGEAGKRFVEEHFRSDVLVAEIERMFEDLLETRRSGAT